MQTANSWILNTVLALLAICGIVGCQRNQPAEAFVPSRWIRIQVADGQDASSGLLTERDFSEIKATVPVVEQAVPEVQEVLAVSINNKTRQVIVSRTLAEAKQLLADARAELVDGRFFTAADEPVDRELIVISQPLANSLFPNENATGKTVFIQNEEFRIVGVLGKPDVALHGVTLADIYMDLSPQLETATVQSGPNRNHSDKPPTVHLDRIWIKVNDLSQVDPTIEILEKLLSSNHPSGEYTLRSELPPVPNSTD